MSQSFAQAPHNGAVCRDCRHDLEVRVLNGRRFKLGPHPTVTGDCDGKVYCSNPDCRNHRTPYAPGKNVNA